MVFEQASEFVLVFCQYLNLVVKYVTLTNSLLCIRTIEFFFLASVTLNPLYCNAIKN